MSRTQEYYRWMAETEARGVSDIYEGWALGVADDPVILARLDALPQAKRQANLLFASARSLGAPVGTWSQLRPWLLDNWESTVARMMSRTTQTNEAARCATLLPAFDLVTGPVALIEVGAAAGLCLYPDRYSYRFVRDDGRHVAVDPPDGPSGVQITCRAVGESEPPARLPDVVWRAGIDLNPLDVRDAEQFEWLEYLIWPEHEERRERLARAAEVAATEPILIDAGDLMTGLPALLAAVPEGATPIVFHTAVLAYLPPDSRAEFESLISELPCIWVSNEGPAVMSGVAAKLPTDLVVGQDFVLAVDGTPIALTSPHGSHYRLL